MNVGCHEVEGLLGQYMENSLNDEQLARVRAHLGTCEACALLSLEIEYTVSLCRSFPEIEPPPHLVDRVLQRTTGLQRNTLSWGDYVRELLRPIYSSPKFATGACLAALSFSIVMNALGLKFDEFQWSDLSPSHIVDSLNRTVNVAYDNGLRRLNDLKILYQIQSKIEELRSESDDATGNGTKPEAKPKTLPQSSVGEHLTTRNFDLLLRDGGLFPRGALDYELFKSS